MKKYLIYFTIYIFLCQSVRSEQMTVESILDEYQNTQENFKSISLKFEATRDTDTTGYKIKNVHLAGRLLRYYSGEIIYDKSGKRCSYRFKRWGNSFTPNDYVPKAHAQDTVLIWDGETYYTYTLNPLSTKGTLIIDESGVRDKDDVYNEILGASFPGGFLFGYFRSPFKRQIGDILRSCNSEEIHLEKKQETVDGSLCYVIKADSRYGEFTVYFDPAHGYNIAMVEIHIRKGDLVMDQTPTQGETHFYLKDIKYKNIGDVWIPIQGTLELDKVYSWGDTSKELRYAKLTEVSLNPKYDSNSFFPTETLEGSRVLYIGDSIQYAWQDGKPVPKVNEFDEEKILEEVNVFKKEAIENPSEKVVSSESSIAQEQKDEKEQPNTVISVNTDNTEKSIPKSNPFVKFGLAIIGLIVVYGGWKMFRS